jgi:hypothetical protein
MDGSLAVGARLGSRTSPLPGDPPQTLPDTVRTLRVAGAVDADTLRAQLDRLWSPGDSRGRSPPGVALSLVETCGRSRDARERDALRLLEAEASAWPVRAPGAVLRAVLVRLDRTDHLLLLAAPEARGAAGRLAAVAAEVARLYPRPVPVGA